MGLENCRRCAGERLRIVLTLIKPQLTRKCSIFVQEPLVGINRTMQESFSRDRKINQHHHTGSTCDNSFTTMSQKPRVN